MRTKKRNFANSRRPSEQKLRFAVVGLGHIAQNSVLPAFKGLEHAELTALVSGDEQKLENLKSTFGVSKTFSYEGFEDCLADPEIDAVYIALPNDLHADACVRAANARKHIICEKPIATSLVDGKRMLDAAIENRVHLMTAYRLHFEPATLDALKTVRSGKLGELRIFNSTFSYQLGDDENIRLQSKRGGGAVFDLGVYCINAARLFFESEPIEVFAVLTHSGDGRFSQVEEGAAVVLKFKGGRVATFTVSFGAAQTSRYELIGTEGRIVMDPGYEYEEALHQTLFVGEDRKEKRFPKLDQFGGEIDAFAEAVRKGEDPSPSALEGIADLRIIEAIFYSDRVGRPVPLGQFPKVRRPSLGQAKKKPSVKPRKLVHVTSPMGK